MTNETSVPVRQTPQNPEIERKASTEYVEDADAELGKKPGDIGGLEVLEHEIIHVSQEDVSDLVTRPQGADIRMTVSASSLTSESCPFLLGCTSYRSWTNSCKLPLWHAAHPN